ncbi:MAG: hypothetical protein AAB649_01055 [Patescibacteria group bacterium]
MDHINKLDQLLRSSPRRGNLLAKHLRERTDALLPHLHEIALKMLKKDIDRWEELFVQYVAGSSTEPDRLEMKVILMHIQNVRRAFFEFKETTQGIIDAGE